jgi:ribosomal protein S12 methylthiotransferase accessory factor
MSRTESLDRVEALVSPYGVVSHVGRRRPARGLEGCTPWLAPVGSGLTEYDRRFANEHGHRRAGAGVDAHDPDRGRLIAIAEAAERYAASDFIGAPVRWARACELDGAVVGLASVPRCSARELAVDGCPLAPIDPEARIRWVHGTDLVTGALTWIPAVMACYRLQYPQAGERFWYRISTGYAVHTDPVEALVRGVCEVIERDVIAVAWLQRLPLPLVTARERSELIDDLLRWCERHFIQTYLFDATSDLGVPAVYCLQITEFDTRLRQSVSCATGRTMTAASEKALLEVLRYRVPRLDPPKPPEEFRDFSGIADGAAYMGRPEMASAFDFLVDDAHLRVAPPRSPLPEEPVEALAAITRTLADRGMRAVAVDRTCTELADVGLTAICVVVPELQPMSLHPLAQYRAHPRLYEAPPLMGLRSVGEEELNPWPVPFA